MFESPQKKIKKEKASKRRRVEGKEARTLKKRLLGTAQNSSSRPTEMGRKEKTAGGRRGPLGGVAHRAGRESAWR